VLRALFDELDGIGVQSEDDGGSEDDDGSEDGGDSEDDD
jgi:hypothetical protein